jgi:hypothetical protein
MRTFITTLLGFTLLAFVPGSGLAQKSGDFRTNGTGGGNWTAAATWQKYNGASWVATATAPTGAQKATILSADSVYIDAAISVTDTLVNQGLLGGAGSLTIADGGVYQHDRDGGSFPLCTWSPGSTLLITGVTSATPNNRNQNFYNIVFDTPGLLSNLNMGLDTVTIGGNISVVATGSSRWYLTTATAGDSTTVTIMGDVIVSGGQFSTNGTSNANTKFVVHHYGNVVVTGGNFSISRGSQGSGSGSTRWYLHNGDFSMSAGTTQNSNSTNAWFVFDKAGTQHLTLGSGATLTALPMVIMAGTTLDVGMSQLRGSGLFTLDAGATLATANAGGLDSVLMGSGTVTLSSGANYAFNGTAPQVTGMALPDTVNDMTINNAAGVTLSKSVVVNGVLHLVAGVFDNTIPFTLGPAGSVSVEGGSLLHPTSVETKTSTVPGTFYVDQNYPNPFNPSTTIRFGTPKDATVRVSVFNLLGQEVATLLDQRLVAGVHAVVFDASRLGSGCYLYRVQYGTTAETKRMVLIK